MNQGLRLFQFFGGTILLSKEIVREGLRRPFYPGLIIEQMYQIGIRSYPLILIVTGSVGMVMALQFGIGLEKFGGKLYVPKIVTVSIIRELGPAFASLMLAARIGAGITSEIGSMKVTQQIDAIRALGTSPIKKIVFPRVLACLIVLPLLTIMANTVGTLGGLLVGAMDLNLDPSFYYQKIVASIKLNDYFSGLGKTIFFSLFISVPACYYGLNVKEGTQDVGFATTKSVVSSCILIVIGDYFLTKLFLLF